MERNSLLGSIQESDVMKRTPQTLHKGKSIKEGYLPINTFSLDNIAKKSKV